MIVKILDAFRRLVPLMTSAITKEVSVTQDHSTLFRGNSIPTKLMSSFTRLLGQPYLDVTIRPIVRDILAYDPDLYEIDPHKTDGDVVANMGRLMEECQRILDVILTSIPLCPPSFRLAAKHLQASLFVMFSSVSLNLASFIVDFCFVIL